MLIDAYSGFIHNCQNLEVDKMSNSKWMGKWFLYIQTMDITQY